MLVGVTDRAAQFEGLGNCTISPPSSHQNFCLPSDHFHPPYLRCLSARALAAALLVLLANAAAAAADGTCPGREITFRVNVDDALLEVVLAGESVTEFESGKGGFNQAPLNLVYEVPEAANAFVAVKYRNSQDNGFLLGTFYNPCGGHTHGFGMKTSPRRWRCISWADGGAEPPEAEGWRDASFEFNSAWKTPFELLKTDEGETWLDPVCPFNLWRCGSDCLEAHRFPVMISTRACIGTQGVPRNENVICRGPSPSRPSLNVNVDNRLVSVAVAGERFDWIDGTDGSFISAPFSAAFDSDPAPADAVVAVHFVDTGGPSGFIASYTNEMGTHPLTHTASDWRCSEWLAAAIGGPADVPAEYDGWERPDFDDSWFASAPAVVAADPVWRCGTISCNGVHSRITQDARWLSGSSTPTSGSGPVRNVICRSRTALRPTRALCTSTPCITGVEARAGASAVVRWNHATVDGTGDESWRVTATPAAGATEDVPASTVTVSRVPGSSPAAKDMTASLAGLAPRTNYNITVTLHSGDERTSPARPVTTACGCFDTGTGPPLVSGIDWGVGRNSFGSPAVTMAVSVVDRSICRPVDEFRYGLFFFTEHPTFAHVTVATADPCEAESVWPQTAAGATSVAGAAGCARRRCAPGGVVWDGVDDSACAENEKLGVSPLLPARSCLDLGRQRPGLAAADTRAWIRPDPGSPAFIVLCDTRAALLGGGWITVADGSAFTVDNLRAVARGGQVEVLVAAVDGTPRASYRVQPDQAALDALLAPWLLDPGSPDAAAVAAEPERDVWFDWAAGPGGKTTEPVLMRTSAGAGLTAASAWVKPSAVGLAEPGGGVEVGGAGSASGRVRAAGAAMLDVPARRYVREVLEPPGRYELANPVVASIAPDVNGADITGSRQPAAPTCGELTRLSEYAFDASSFDAGGDFPRALLLGSVYHVCAYYRIDDGAAADLAPASCLPVSIPFRGRVRYLVKPSDAVGAAGGVACVRVTAFLDGGSGSVLASEFTGSASGECVENGVTHATADGLQLGEVLLDFVVTELVGAATTLPIRLAFSRVDTLNNGTKVAHRFQFEADGAPGNEWVVDVDHMEEPQARSATDLSIQRVEGRLTYAGTAEYDKDSAGRPCPVVGATVCASINPTLDCPALSPLPDGCLCTDTSDEGFYQISMPVGARVYMQMASHGGRYRGSRRLALEPGPTDRDVSSFRPVEGAALEDDPWVYVAEQSFVDIDFELFVREDVSVLVRGGDARCGGCPLGLTALAAREPANCPQYERFVFLQPATDNGCADGTRPEDCVGPRYASDSTLFVVRTPPFPLVKIDFEGVDAIDTVLSSPDLVEAYFDNSGIRRLIVADPGAPDGGPGSALLPLLWEYHAQPDATTTVDLGRSELSCAVGDAAGAHALQQGRDYGVRVAVREQYGTLCSCPVNGFVEVRDQLSSGAAVQQPDELFVTTGADPASVPTGYSLERIENGEYRFTVRPSVPLGAVLPDQPLEEHLQFASVRVQPNEARGVADTSVPWYSVPPVRAFVTGVYRLTAARSVELPQSEHERPVFSWLRRPPGDASYTELARNVEQGIGFEIVRQTGQASSSFVGAEIGGDTSKSLCIGFIASTCFELFSFESRLWLDSTASRTSAATVSSGSRADVSFSERVSSARAPGLAGPDGDTAVLPVTTYVVSDSVDVNIDTGTCVVSRAPALTWGVSPSSFLDSVSVKTQYSICTVDIPRACRDVAELEGWVLPGTGEPDTARVASELNLPQCLPFDTSGLAESSETRRWNTPPRAGIAECSHHAQYCEPGCEARGTCPGDLLDVDALRDWPMPPTTRDVSGLNAEQRAAFERTRRRQRAAVLGWHRVVQQNCVGKRRARPQKGLFAQWVDDTLAGEPASSLGALQSISTGLADRLKAGASAAGAGAAAADSIVSDLAAGRFSAYDPESGKAVLSFEGGSGAYEHTAAFSRTASAASSVEFTYRSLREQGFFLEASVFGIIAASVETVQRTTINTGGAAVSESQETFETTTTFHLEDSNVGDQFLAELLVDPFDGTPVFRTLGGRSSCPHEPGTDQRERTLLLLEGGDGNAAAGAVPHDQVAVFDLQLLNDSPLEEDRTYVLEPYAPGNANNARLEVRGASLTQGAITVPMPYGVAQSFEIGLAPNLRNDASYTNVPVRLSSKCESDMAASGSLSRAPITSTAYLSASFVFPCAELEWRGDVGREDSFTVNSEAGGVLLLVAANLRSAVERWDASERIEWVRVQYRRAGRPGWLDSYAIAATDEADSLGHDMRSDEADAGVASFVWDLEHQGITDGEYQLRVRAQCASSGYPDLDTTFSRTVTGLVDRVAPRRFGVPEPRSAEFLPGRSGDQISVEFDEKLDCNGQFGYSARLVDTISACDGDLRGTPDLAEPRSNPPLLGVCDERRLYFRFSAAVRLSQVSGKSVCMSVTGADDVAGNTAADVSWAFRVPAVRADRVGARVSRLAFAVPITLTSTAGWQLVLRGELAGIMGVDAARIEVGAVADPGAPDSSSLVDVTVLPPPPEAGAKLGRTRGARAQDANNGTATAAPAAADTLLDAASAPGDIDASLYPVTAEGLVWSVGSGVEFDFSSSSGRDGGTSGADAGETCVAGEDVVFDITGDAVSGGTFEADEGGTLSFVVHHPLSAGNSVVPTYDCGVSVETALVAGEWSNSTPVDNFDETGRAAVELDFGGVLEGDLYVRAAVECTLLDGSGSSFSRTTATLKGSVGRPGSRDADTSTESTSGADDLVFFAVAGAGGIATVAALMLLVARRRNKSLRLCRGAAPASPRHGGEDSEGVACSELEAAVAEKTLKGSSASPSIELAGRE